MDDERSKMAASIVEIASENITDDILLMTLKMYLLTE